MFKGEISGVFAALLTPRTAEGNIDAPALRSLVHVLMNSGISSFAVNGATGEFWLNSPAQLRTILSTVRRASEGTARILCCVGAAGAAQSIELARVAESEEVEGLLLPMPYFFPYEQEDLDLFCRTFADSTQLPVLLYNLPQFSSGLDKETVRVLISEVPNIVGIKDSSGSLDILRYLTERGVQDCRIVGGDAVLAPALREGICNGVVSGIAGVVPEAILAPHARKHQFESAGFAWAARRIDEFVEHLKPFPYPWGLKWIAEAREILQATFSLPITQHRFEQRQRLVAWFAGWIDERPPAADDAY
jgi:dihydrodipicolinate synthase/N-acetylneuraminate lyase